MQRKILIQTLGQVSGQFYEHITRFRCSSWPWNNIKCISYLKKSHLCIYSVSTTMPWLELTALACWRFCFKRTLLILTNIISTEWNHRKSNLSNLNFSSNHNLWCILTKILLQKCSETRKKAAKGTIFCKVLCMDLVKKKEAESMQISFCWSKWKKMHII